MKTRFQVPSKRVPAKAWREIKRWDPARTRHTISGLARSLRIGSVGKNLLLMIVLFTAKPAGSRPAGLLSLIRPARFLQSRPRSTFRMRHPRPETRWRLGL